MHMFLDLWLWLCWQMNKAQFHISSGHVISKITCYYYDVTAGWVHCSSTASGIVSESTTLNSQISATPGIKCSSTVRCVIINKFTFNDCDFTLVVVQNSTIRRWCSVSIESTRLYRDHRSSKRYQRSSSISSVIFKIAWFYFDITATGIHNSSWKTSIRVSKIARFYCHITRMNICYSSSRSTSWVIKGTVYDCNITIPGIKYSSGGTMVITECACFYRDTANVWVKDSPSSPSGIVVAEWTVHYVDDTALFYIHCSTILCHVALEMTLADIDTAVAC